MWYDIRKKHDMWLISDASYHMVFTIYHIIPCDMWYEYDIGIGCLTSTEFYSFVCETSSLCITSCPHHIIFMIYHIMSCDMWYEYNIWYVDWVLEINWIWPYHIIFMIYHTLVSYYTISPLHDTSTIAPFSWYYCWYIDMSYQVPGIKCKYLHQ